MARKLGEDNGLSFDPSAEIIVTVGANEAVFMTMMGFSTRGTKYWFRSLAAQLFLLHRGWRERFRCRSTFGKRTFSSPTSMRFEPK